uniref:Uncharacterized protein n=1 Tax=Arundo donax TaxID=35708 RepID=A0A0A9BBN5_ARUDO
MQVTDQSMFSHKHLFSLYCSLTVSSAISP